MKRPEINLSQNERVLSTLIGSAILTPLFLGKFGSLKKRPLLWGVAALGSGIILRGMTGHCPINEKTGRNSAIRHKPDRMKGPAHLDRKFGSDSNRDMIEQASWESFPASDPPAW